MSKPPRWSIRIAAVAVVVGLAGLLVWEAPAAIDRSSRGREVSSLTAQLVATSSRLADLQRTGSDLTASVATIRSENGSLGKTGVAQAGRIKGLKKMAASLRSQIAAAGG